MARDPVVLVARMREIAVARATRDLAAAMAEERAAAAALAAHADMVRREHDGAARDRITDFTAWLPHARARGAHLAAALADAQARLARRREALVARRLQAKAFEEVRQRLSARAALPRERRAHAAMDEIAANAHRLNLSNEAPAEEQ